MIFGALNIYPWLCPKCGLTNYIGNKKCADWECREQRPNTMNHPFQSSIIDSAKCKICKRPESDHGKDAVCEACTKTGDCVDVNGILMCPSCLENELVSKPSFQKMQQMAYSNPFTANPLQQLAESVKQSDAKLSGKPEFFNAETISIEEIKQKLEADSSITNKRLELGKIVFQRIVDFQKAIFDADQVRFELGDRQEANRRYLNNLAAQMTAEEREIVRLKDINYPVQQPKLTVPRAPSTKAKSNKEELREAASKYKVDAVAIQTICIARNMSVAEAVELMIKMGIIKVASA